MVTSTGGGTLQVPLHDSSGHTWGGTHLVTGLIFLPGSHQLLGNIPRNLAPNANVFPSWGRTRIPRISSCLFNYTHRMDCILVPTRNQTSKNATVRKLDPPSELCQTCEHMCLEVRDNLLLSKCLMRIFLVTVSTCSGLGKCCIEGQDWQSS